MLLVPKLLAVGGIDKIAPGALYELDLVVGKGFLDLGAQTGRSGFIVSNHLLSFHKYRDGQAVAAVLSREQSAPTIFPPL